ncbi:MAG: hypothetical protein ACTSU7_15075 [Candidatus Heimdallarchaeaceae archaeon]
MNSKEEKKDFVSSSKIEEMGKEKVVIELKEEKILTPSELKDKKTFSITYFILETIVIITTVFVFTLPLIDVFNSSNYFSDIAVFFMVFLTGFSLLNTYFYLFKLDSKFRTSAFILRFSLILLSLIMFVIFAFYSYISDIHVTVMLISLYALSSQMILKIYLLTSKKSIKERLFRRAVAGSPSELEWRKFDVLSGYLAIILGIFMLQIFWLIYHGIIRKPVIERTKKKLIVESLEFGKEINLTSVALEIGVSLEEVIFKLKQLSLKGQLRIEFTRYGAVLNEIRSPKWYSNIMREKYETFLHSQKESKIEIKASKFIELASRDRVSVDDLRKILGLKEDYPIKDLVLLLPNKVLEIKKPLFSKVSWVYINLEHSMLKREKIVKIFVENSAELFK